MLTGENGILTQAQRAKNETEEARIEEENTLTTYEDYINNATNDTAMVGEIVTGGNKQYSNHGTAVIPEGFMIVPGLDDVSEGLVISDNASDTEEGDTLVAEGNQFVWVPVPVFEEFKREHFGTQSQKWWSGTFVTDKMSESNIYEPIADGIANTTEVEKMYKSVKDNKGFYIGRYEAGKDAKNETKVVSKKNADVYNFIGWSNSEDMNIETGGAVEKARNFDIESGHTNVTSTLPYGVQWDGIMRWLSKGTEEERRWLTDSSGKGNYNTNAPIKTGSVSEYQMKHIYDLAGNVDEWTMEVLSTTTRVSRGGYYLNSGKDFPCSLRSYGSPVNEYRTLGFRIAFYL